MGITVPSHYACRTRNSQRGARLSEHAKGNAIDMAGLAMFDIADSYAGGTISLRFAFASDGDSSQAEGINIDNIMVTGCLSGDPTCDDPPGDVPAPASLALAAFGVMALRRHRSKR